jgi:hypothetical protein
VLGNDTDPDGDTLTAVLASGPSHGSLALNPDGSFTYAPAANFNGTDSFTYRAGDGELNSNPATVTIQVRAVTAGAPGPPAPPGSAARAVVSDLAATARCYRDTRLDDTPTGDRRRMRVTYPLSAPATVRLTVRRRIGSPQWRSCPPRRGRRPGRYREVDSRNRTRHRGHEPEPARLKRAPAPQPRDLTLARVAPSGGRDADGHAVATHRAAAATRHIHPRGRGARPSRRDYLPYVRHTGN